MATEELLLLPSRFMAHTHIETPLAKVRVTRVGTDAVRMKFGVNGDL